MITSSKLYRGLEISWNRIVQILCLQRLVY